MVESGTHSSFHSNCDHQVIHCKINLQVQYPPPYQRHIWNFAKPKKEATLSALKNADRNHLLTNKTVHQQVNLLNDIILNVFENSVSNKFITCDGRDSTWINNNIKNKIEGKSSTYINYKENDKKAEDYELLIKVISEVSQLIEKSKDE